METVSRDELKGKIDRGEAFALVETLQEVAYKHEHLPGAVNLPPDRVRELAPNLLPDKGAEIIVYCSSPTWHASENVARELAAMGYANVKDYAGGKSDWIEAGLPTESDHRHGEGRWAAMEATRVTVEEVRERMERGEPLSFVDTRNPAAWGESDAKLPGAIRVPAGELEQHLSEIPSDRAVITYCTWPHEGSSASVALQLLEKGWKNVHPLYGGFDAWRQAGLPVDQKWRRQPAPFPHDWRRR